METSMTIQRTFSKTAFGVIAASAFALMAVDTASAQVNCSAGRTSQIRAWCYQQSAQIYRQQSQAYANIARQQYQTHVNVGRYIGYAPLIGRYAAPAWNAPRAIYNMRYGRP
jgi:hypothetical protein